MTYTPQFTFQEHASSSPAAGTSVNSGSYAYSQRSLVFVFVGNLGTASTGVTNSGSIGGTWTRIANITGTGVGCEIWMGYGFNATADGVTARTTLVAFAASTKASYGQVHYELSAPVASAPTASAVTATGNSVTPDPGTVTPAVGDIVVAMACWANVTAPSATTDTPGAKESLQTGVATAATGTRSEFAYRNRSMSTTATKRTWTITSAQWAAANAKVTLPALTEVASLAVKGFDTAAADAASSF